MAPHPANSRSRNDFKEGISNTTANTQETIGVHKNYHLKWVGQKFETNGLVRPFPGNTILCHLPSDILLYCSLLKIHEKLQNSKFAMFYTILPPSSWHMTVFEGVCDQIRAPGYWPKDLSLDAPLSSCHSLFKEKLGSFNLFTETPLRMAIQGLSLSESGIRLVLAPINAAEEQRLRRLRDRLSETLQIRHPGHDTYIFHLSIGYRIRHSSQSQEQALSVLLQEYYLNIPHVFELGVPEFCHFDDMFAFHRQFFLGTKS